MIAGTLSRYFAMRFVASVVGSFIGVIALAAMIDYVELMRRGADWPNATAWLLAKISMYRVPQLTERILPFTVLVGAMSCYLTLSRRHELVVARAAGVSAWQFVAPAVVAAFLVGAVATTLYNPVSAMLHERSKRLEADMQGATLSALQRSTSGFWVRQKSSDGAAIINAISSREQGAQLGGVSVYTFDNSGHFQDRIEAKSAALQEGYWLFEDARIYVPGKAPDLEQTYRLPTNLTLEQVRESFATPETVPFWQLPTYIDLADRAGLLAAGYRLQYQQLLARPFLLAAMVLLAASVSLRFFRFGGVQKMIVSGLARVPVAVFAALLAFVLGAVCCPFALGAEHRRRFIANFGGASPPNRGSSSASNAPMLVQATEIRYDYTNNSVAAVGNVQIYYGGATVEADQVIYDQKTKRLRAEGNVRLTEPDGKITYGQVIDLTDDYRDGFVDLLRLETADDTRFAAARADRANGNYTVLQNGVYTACEPCKDDPRKPPLWQVKAARIIHDEGEKMLYFEDARIEFFGVPLAYVPFMSAPDPTVKRKSGFLFPGLSQTSQYGFGAELKYFWALAPNYDLTLSTLLTTRQGALFKGEWRQRLLDGSYTIRAAGIFQQDPGYFATRDGANSATAGTFRGAIQSAGQFALSDKWVWGWTGLLITDSQFLYDYQLRQFTGAFDPFQTGFAAEGVSQLYLSGAGDRSYFDIRSIYYYGFSQFDHQPQLPIIHPVLDYSNVLPQQLLGGEFSYKINLTSLTRQQAEFDAVTQSAQASNACSSPTADTAVPANCLLRGIPGDYTRFSAQADWRRTLVTDNGQMITPFFRMRGDVATVTVDNTPGVSNYIATGTDGLARGMPAAGVEYRYPFISVSSWGTQTIEPIAQVVVRPNETNIGKFPNEDAQSLVFDTSNLFEIDKYSGWDRVEGGGRANVGIQYTAQINRAGSLNVMFGQSYQLFGLNSFANPDITNTGLNSGLDKNVSDYVSSVTYQPNPIYSFAVRGRFDQSSFTPQRLEIETRANFERWTLQFLYGDYAPQPLLGFLTRREGFLTGASLKLTANWILLGSTRYDIESDRFDQARLGVGYVDDCFMLSVNWLSSYTYTTVAAPVRNDTVMLQFSLRTLGPDALAPVGVQY